MITDIVAYRFQFSGVEKTSLSPEGPKARNKSLKRWLISFLWEGAGCAGPIWQKTPFSLSKIKDVKYTASIFAVVLSSLHAMQAREYHYNQSKPTLNGHAFFP